MNIVLEDDIKKKKRVNSCVGLIPAFLSLTYLSAVFICTLWYSRTLRPLMLQSIEFALDVNRCFISPPMPLLNAPWPSRLPH
jgi:hypothetical protein